MLTPAISGASRDTESQFESRLDTRLRLLWGTGLIVTAAVLFSCYLRQASTVAVNSDGAAIVLQAWDMLHGNLLLRGWHLSDVSFYTTELPEYMLVGAARGLRPDIVHLCAALTYTLIVILAALVAKGAATGRLAAVRMLLAAGIIVAPQSNSVVVLLMSPDHTGTAVPLLLTLLVLDRGGRRAWVPAAVGVLLAWSLIGDPLVLVAGVLPIIAVCVLRVVRGLRDRDGVAGLRDGLAGLRFELWLGAAAIVAVLASSAATRVIHAAGGWRLNPGVKHFLPASQMSQNFWQTIDGLLRLFGADFFGLRFGLDALFAVIHLAGFALVVFAVWRTLRHGLLRGDLVPAVLAVAMVANVAAYMVLFRAAGTTVREMVPVMAFGAALAGRVVAGPLVKARLEAVLAAGLAAYVFMLAAGSTQPALPPHETSLTAWLTAHKLTDGVASYWQAPIVTLNSGGKLHIATVIGSHDGRIVRGHWEVSTSWFDPRTHSANFLVTGAQGVTAHAAVTTFGKPAQVFHVQQYTIMVWHKNLLAAL